MTLAIAHAEDHDDFRVGVLDALREVRPPFSPGSAARYVATPRSHAAPALSASVMFAPASVPC
jgi:hypothetical protein